MRKLIAIILSMAIINIGVTAEVNGVLESQGRAYVKDSTGKYWPAQVVYTTDGNGNITPISGGGGGSGGTVTQGNAGLTPWLFDFKLFNGVTPSASNPIPYRLSDGTNFISPASALASLPDRSTMAQPVSVKGQQIFRTTFANAVASGVDTSFWSTPVIGSGMTVSQSGGNLVITSGVTTNDETIIRSNQTFKGNLELKWSTILSQRIVNQNFYVELVDLIGDGLAYTINSATSVTVTIPSNPFTSANVGQSLIMQQIAGTTGAIPGRYVIASVSGNTVTFTVASWPATGTGTLSLVGWNYIRATYSGATATNAIIETQRRGYNTNASFTATINTTASPGHIGAVSIEDSQVALMDQLQAAAASLNLARRAEIVQSLPEETTPMYLQFHVVNGSTAPASTTTWTIGMASVASRVVQNVALNSITPMSQNAPLPATITNTPSVTVSSGTITTVSSATLAAGTNTVGYVGLALPTTVADIASAALTATTTTATITPTFGTAYQVNIPVTAVSGTTPTLDVVIQESMDSGTNWYDVYHFPRITATGMFVSPVLPLVGNRVRYVQTVSGTSPSFTRSTNRSQISWNGSQLLRQIFDRAVTLTTLSSTTASILSEGCRNLQLTINLGAATTAPALQLQVSEDGTNWVSVGTALTGVASSTVMTTVQNVSAKFAREFVTTAGATVTAGFVQIKAYN